MLKIFIQGHSFYYDLIELTRAFGIKSIIVDDCKFDVDKQDYLLSSTVKIKSHIAIITTVILKDGEKLAENIDRYNIKNKSMNDISVKDNIKMHIKRGAYFCIKHILNKELEWGILTGVRPLKFAHKYMDKIGNWDCVYNLLISNYYLYPSKAKLLVDTAKYQRKYICDVDKKKVSIYISIPFCISRCIYCSFVSNTLDKCYDMIKPYIDALLYEIKICIEYLLSNEFKIENIYIGGGTPTSIDLEHLEDILTFINENINMSYIKEYTVEAGRPDTITLKKLQLLKEQGVNRISINPQTMNKNTLSIIKRTHTPEQIIEKYKMARQVGFDWINMDLILGLPLEDETDVENTINQVLALSPKNITVHTMAIKRSSILMQDKDNIPLTNVSTVTNMMKIVYESLLSNDYIPYYLYKQKYMLANLENIGFCKPSYESIYNIKMMGENQTVIAFGAGAVSKIYYPDSNRIERVMNVKNLSDYISRVEQMAQKKLDALYALTTAI